MLVLPITSRPSIQLYELYLFRPQTSIDETTGKVADPIEGKSYEIGVKSAWLDNKLTGTLAIFRTEENNYPLRPTDSHPLNRTSAISDLRSQGVEAQDN